MQEDDKFVKKVGQLSTQAADMMEEIVEAHQLPKGAELDILLCALMTTLKRKNNDKNWSKVDLEYVVASAFNQYASRIGVNIYARDYVDVPPLPDGSNLH